MIDWININYGLSIEKLPLDLSPLTCNGWLAGFIDADGCFSIKGFTSGVHYIQFSFYLCQHLRDTHGDFISIMEAIANF